MVRLVTEVLAVLLAAWAGLVFLQAVVEETLMVQELELQPMVAVVLSVVAAVQ
jgi:hypothetical protein